MLKHIRKGLWKRLENGIEHIDLTPIECIVADDRSILLASRVSIDSVKVYTIGSLSARAKKPVIKYTCPGCTAS